VFPHCDWDKPNERTDPGERLPVAAILRTYKRLEPPRPEEGFAALKRDRYLE
jgi:hypothetical protein